MMRHRGFRAFSACLLAAVFFASQAFACCYTNRQLGHAFASLFAPRPAVEHACCHKAAPVPEKSGCAKECCIQDAGQKLPQLGTAAMEIPVPVEHVVAVLEPMPEPAKTHPAPYRIRSASDPPLYLTSLRLLI